MTLDATVLSATQLVDKERGLISRDIFVNPELYKLEQERVFACAWLFVGLEDQVRKPGDYFVSRMGEESVILSRDRDNTVHVFLNSCRHRGMKVCRYDEGNTPVFTCPYHGWSYAGDGSLVGVPRYKDAYREELDKSQWGLVEVALLANFHGTIWATWDPEAPSFEEYLGDVKPYMDMRFNKPDGSEADLEVIPGVLKWTMPCNWKWGAENFIGDWYHGPSHRSVDLVRISPSGRQGRHTTDYVREQAHPYFLSHHGHGLRATIVQGDYPPYTPAYPNDPVAEEYFRTSYEKRRKLLEERARIRHSNGTIFPNASPGTGNETVAVWHPNGPDSTEVWRFYFMQRDTPQEVKDLQRHYIMRYGGPAGLTEQDDMENWNYAHKASKGVIARRYPYNYLIGHGHEMGTSNHPGVMKDGVITESGVSEQNQRRMYYMWADLMDSEGWDDLREKGLWR